METRVIRGDRLIEMLLAMSAGESAVVGTETWMSLDDLQFHVTADFGEGEERFVTLGIDQSDLDPEAFYEVERLLGEAARRG